MARNNDIDAIERDLEETRARTESTIQALQNKLQPRAVLDEATRFFQGTDSGEYAERVTRNGLMQAKENPIPLALIAAGVGLLATKRPGRPAYVQDSQSGYDSDYVPATDYYRQDEELGALYDTEYEDTHRVIGAAETIDTTYTRMNDEDDDAYQRRLYEARGKAFKVERSSSDDDDTFRKKVDDRLKAAKAKRDEYQAKAGDFRKRQSRRAADLKARAGDAMHRAGDAMGNASDRSRQAARQGVRRSGELYEENPLVAALMAVAAGAVTGAMFDVTDKERQALGGVADDINEGVKQLNEAANEKVAEYARKVEDAAEAADDKVGEVEKDLGGAKTKGGANTTRAS